MTARALHAGRRFLFASVVVAAGAWLGDSGLAAQQAPVFRSTVDLIAVDVQVVDRDGNPIDGLQPDQFEVTIGGRRRRVVSADFIRQAAHDATTYGRLAEPNPSIVPAVTDETGRLFVIAFDDGSFDPGTVAPTLEALDHFIQNLEPSDRVGLYVYPSGPRLNPTTERAQLRAALRRITGQRMRPQNRYNLRASEIVDISAALAAGIRARSDLGQLSEQVGRGGQPTLALLQSPDPMIAALAAVVERECPEEPSCAATVLNDVAATAPQLEQQTESSLNGLAALLDGLTVLPGRKTVLLVSAGILVSDRADGRPDAGDVARIMGQSAAAANATVYTIQVAPPPSSGMGASMRRAGVLYGNRDRQLLGSWLDDFADAAGGVAQYVPLGPGDFAFDRVLRETSAHYLLGVEPADTDRDGKPHRLNVQVRASGANIHSRQWVIVPAKAQ